VKVGDLVRFRSTTPDERTPIQKVGGVVIEDRTMMCSHGGVEPYRMGPLLILWSNERGLQREVFSSLEVINESR